MRKKRYKGYSLKYHTLKRCLADMGIDDLIVISDLLHIRVSTLKRKFKRHEKFNRRQISKLVYFLGAENTIEIIYFPTIYMKRRVYWEVFGKYKQEERSYERFKEIRKS